MILFKTILLLSVFIVLPARDIGIDCGEVGYLSFAENSSTIDSTCEHNKLKAMVDFLSSEKKLNIEIEGRRSIIESIEICMSRSESVKKYLVGQGISSDRLIPVSLDTLCMFPGNSNFSHADNCPRMMQDARNNNRLVTFKVHDKGKYRN